MPRDTNGNYTLPSSVNPVITGTVIESTWANTTLDDTAQALTDSLDRYGRGGMLAPFKMFDGSVSVPGQAFTNESSTGFSRPSAGTLVVSVLGSEKWRATSSGIAITGTLSASGGWAGDFSVPGNFSVTGTSTLSGSVGIGAAPLVAKLDVSTGGALGLAVRSGTSIAATSEFAANGNGVGTQSVLVGQLASNDGMVVNRANASLQLGANNVTRQWILADGRVSLGSASAAANSVLTLTGASGSGQLTVNNGTAVSFFGGGTSAGSVYGTSNNVPLDVYINSAFSARFDTASNFGLGTTTIGNFGHGGTNRILQIANAGTAANSQSHAMLSSAFNGSGASAIGSVSWALPAAGSGGGARLATISANTLSSHTVGAPAAAVTISTKNSADASPVDRLVISDVVTYNGLEIGFRKLNISGSLENGKAIKITSGMTLNAGSASNVGDIATIYNDSASSVTLTEGGGLTLRLAGTTLTGNRTLAARGIATIWYSTASEIIISGAGVA